MFTCITCIKSYSNLALVFIQQGCSPCRAVNAERFPLPQFVEKLTCPNVNDRNPNATSAKTQNLQSMIL